MVLRKGVVCPFCGCLCDDLEVEVEDGRIVSTKNACPVSRSKFLSHAEDRARPMVGGREVSVEEAIGEAARILREADFPLIYGLSSTESDAQRMAVRLAELTGASLDNTSSTCHGPTVLAAQECGAVKCTLGEVKNRADLIVFWGCNPAEAHIRHPIRYSITPVGMYRQGKKERFVVHVDVRETRTSKMVNQFVKVQMGRDYELLSALRAAIRGYEVKEAAGVPGEVIKGLAERMKGCRFGILFFGMGLTMSRGKNLNIDAALRLVRDLNEHTKFLIMPMRGHFNVSGANEVLTWLTGYPFALNFSRGYPVYNPGEFSAVDLLRRGECDAALILASDPAAHFPSAAVRHLASVPTVVIDPKVSLTSKLARVVIPSAIAGIECEGTAYRMDGVPLRLKRIVDSPYLPDREILERIMERVGG